MIRTQFQWLDQLLNKWKRAVIKKPINRIV